MKSVKRLLSSLNLWSDILCYCLLLIVFSQIQVKIIARDSLEEIAQVSLTIKEIEKAEIVFEDRTVLNIYGKKRIICQ